MSSPTPNPSRHLNSCLLLSNSGVATVTSPAGMSSSSLFWLLGLLWAGCQWEYHKLVAGRQEGSLWQLNFPWYPAAKLKAHRKDPGQGCQEPSSEESVKKQNLKSTEGPLFAGIPSFRGYPGWCDSQASGKKNKKVDGHTSDQQMN